MSNKENVNFREINFPFLESIVNYQNHPSVKTKSRQLVCHAHLFMVDATFDDSWFDFQFSISCGVADGSQGTQTSDFL